METHNRKNMPDKKDINVAKKGHGSEKNMEEPNHHGSSPEFTTGRGMHGSKHQGGAEFDREKNADGFDLAQRKDEIEEDLNNTGQGSGRGGAASGVDDGPNELKHYSGSVQHRAKPKHKR